MAKIIGYEYTVKVTVGGDFYAQDNEVLAGVIYNAVKEDTDYDVKVKVVVTSERWTGD